MANFETTDNFKGELELKNYHILSFNKFFGEYREKIMERIAFCKFAYDVTDDDINLYIEKDLENKGIIYYGFAVDELPEEIEEKMPANVEILSLTQYVKTQDRDLLERLGFVDSAYKPSEYGKSGSDLPKIAYEIRDWMEENSFNSFLKAVTSRVKGQVEVDMVVANVYNYLRCVSMGQKHNNNMLLAAPSGCGKTETFRAIKDYFAEKLPDLPVYQLDITSVTEEGFKGRDTGSIVQPLMEKPQTNGVGIVFMDEFDKKLLPSYTAGGNDVNAAVQAQILTLIEGRIESAQQNVGSVKIDTGNTLFIGLGAFNPCRKKKLEARQAIGFGQQTEEIAKYYDNITREDMVELGGSYELIGRFSSIINYYELSYEAVDEIINMQVEKVSKGYGYQIEIGSKMREYLHENANGKYGCRILESLLREKSMAGYLEILKGNKGTNATIEIDGPETARVRIEDSDLYAC